VKPNPRLRGRFALAAAWWAAIAAVATLAGCGPGTGGTGTGPGASLSLFDATAASICASDLAAQIACPASATNPSQPDATRGTSVVLFADTAQGGNIAVQIEESRIELSARCQRLRFTGDWGITAASDARFFGSYVIEPLGPAVVASLSVQAAPGARNGEVTIVVREVDGRVVLGPVVLQRVPVPVAEPAACP